MKLPNQYDAVIQWDFTPEGNITDVRRKDVEVTEGEFMTTSEVFAYIKALKKSLKKGKKL